MVERLWPGCTLVVLASGPSLTEADVAFVRGKARVMCINDTYRLAQWADALYAADHKWWAYHEGVPTFAGLKYSIQAESAQWPGVVVLRNTGYDGIERNPGGLRTGHNSTYQGMNLGLHLGATRIVLLGADMSTGENGREHFFGDHPEALRGGPPKSEFVRWFETMVDPLRELGIEVVNCSRRTALTCFPLRPLEEVLA